MNSVLDSDAGISRKIHFIVGLFVLSGSFLGSVAAVKFLILP